MLVAHLQQPASPAPQEAPVEDPGPAPALDAKAVLAAAERFPWALAAPGERHWPDGAFLDVALGAVRTEERQGHIERLEAFVEQHRTRLKWLLRAYGPGSRPASRGRYALIGQPETLVILERTETHPFGLRAQWEKELEDVFSDDLEFAWVDWAGSVPARPSTMSERWTTAARSTWKALFCQAVVGAVRAAAVPCGGAVAAAAGGPRSPRASALTAPAAVSALRPGLCRRIGSLASGEGRLPAGVLVLTPR
ncbi:hypothetical protein ACWDE9_29785 [Streptomyces olivaceoviridis]